jgi:hypothetical protein
MRRQTSIDCSCPQLAVTPAAASSNKVTVVVRAARRNFQLGLFAIFIENYGQWMSCLLWMLLVPAEWECFGNDRYVFNKSIK